MPHPIRSRKVYSKVPWASTSRADSKVVRVLGQVRRLEGNPCAICVNPCTRANMEVVDAPLCIDSAEPAALEATLAIYRRKALINSATGEESMLEKGLPLAAKYHAAVIGVISDETGVPATPKAPLAAIRKIVQREADHGIPAEDNIIDASP